VTLAAVADGVSTADLGTGRRAAEALGRVFEEVEGELTQLPTGEGWVDAASSWLERVVARANEAVVGEWNGLHGGRWSRAAAPPDVYHPHGRAGRG